MNNELNKSLRSLFSAERRGGNVAIEGGREGNGGRDGRREKRWEHIPRPY